jgi:hypothetical protein
MGVVGKQSGQGDKQGGKNPDARIEQVNYPGISGITDSDLGRQPGAGTANLRGRSTVLRCQEICTGSTDFGRFRLNISRRTNSPRCWVFGSLGATGAFSETTPYDPRSPYSASKAASGHLVRT